jgi:transcriptional regulator with XRE-family HTH domain
MSTAFIGHVERGTRKLSVETLLRIAKELNVSVDYLLTESQLSNPDLLLQITSILSDKEEAKTHTLLSAIKILTDHFDEIE